MQVFISLTMQLFLLIIYILTLSFYEVSAEEENWSITPDEPPTATVEEVAKRYQEDEIEDQQSSLFLRTTRAKWGGGRFKPAKQKKILEAHNKYRKNVSPVSGDMNELLWSPKLAEQAQAWSDGCYYEHPNKQEHTDYEGIGQNLYIRWLDEGGRNPPPVTDPVDKWHDEVRDYHYESTSCNRNAVCGHYTQVVWAQTTKVGCGIKFCPMARSRTRTFENAWLITCNYSPAGNMQGQAPYKEGGRCSQCEKGFCLKNLCSKCKPNEKGCVCRKECHNCGQLDRKKCTCTCDDGFYGPSCEERCENKHRNCGANPGWPKYWCNNEAYPFVDQFCPAMCGACTPGPARARC